jgi:hypothetical protein
MLCWPIATFTCTGTTSTRRISHLLEFYVVQSYKNRNKAIRSTIRNTMQYNVLANWTTGDAHSSGDPAQNTDLFMIPEFLTAALVVIHSLRDRTPCTISDVLMESEYGCSKISPKCGQMFDKLQVFIGQTILVSIRCHCQKPTTLNQWPTYIKAARHFGHRQAPFNYRTFFI